MIKRGHGGFIFFATLLVMVLSGEEVMALLDLKPGPQVGRALEALLLAQAEGRVRTREEARAFLLYWKGDGTNTPA